MPMSTIAISPQRKQAGGRTWQILRAANVTVRSAARVAEKTVNGSAQSSNPTLGRTDLLPLVLLLAACGDEQDAAVEVEQSAAPQSPPGLEPWHSDFPGAPKVW